MNSPFRKRRKWRRTGIMECLCHYTQLVTSLLLLLIAVRTQGDIAFSRGNYFPCSDNPCQNGGQCLSMQHSPSPFHLAADVSKNARFFTSPDLATMSWSDALNFCLKQSATLLLSENEASLKLAHQFVKEIGLSGRTVDGFWTNVVRPHTCQTLLSGPLGLLVFRNCHGHDLIAPLCQKVEEEEEEEEVSKTEMKREGACGETSVDQHLLFSCQCPAGTVGENCRTAEPGIDSKFICLADESSTLVKLETRTPNKTLVIDHVAFGRPFRLPSSFPSQGGSCSSDLFAKDMPEYCVASNSLAAVIYWCQGKSSCQFTTDMLYQAISKKTYHWPFLANSKETRSFKEVERACQMTGASVPLPRSEEELKQILTEVEGSLGSEGSRQHFWLDARAEEADYFKKNIRGVKENHKACIVLVVEHQGNVPFLEWSSCQPAEGSFQGLCVRTGPPLTRSGRGSGRDRGTVSILDDVSCLADLNTKILEVRYHEESPYGRLEKNCPFAVDFRRDHTCYKRTPEKLSWREARQQCWEWGGDLAFFLDPESEECGREIYKRTEEYWVANPSHCHKDDVRCPLNFADSSSFVEGTFAKKFDLCHHGHGLDRGCETLRGCNRRRQGLCAMPATRQPRTPMPDYGPGPDRTCPTVQGEDMGPQWPYPDYDWGVVGQAGQLANQSCPPDQSGSATWLCGCDGRWATAQPDMTHCVKAIDVENSLDKLNRTESVPSEVLEDLNSNLSAGEEELAPGDILGAMEVLERAVEVQNERIVESDDPDTFANSFTSESLILLDQLLNQPVPWLAIESDEKKKQLTAIQTNVDQLSASLINNSRKLVEDEEGREFVSPNNLLKLKVIPIANLPQDGAQFVAEESFTSGQSSISVGVKSSSGQEGNRTISFQSFENFECILQRRRTCSVLGDPSSLNLTNALNSVVLGATLYHNTDVVRLKQGEEDEVSVSLDFYYDYNGVDFNLSNPQCTFWDEAQMDWSSEGCKLISIDVRSCQCQCAHLTNFAALLDINGNLEKSLEEKPVLKLMLTWITLFGCSLSIASLLACLYIFLCVRGVRGDTRTIIHQNLCFCLLLAEILLLVGLDPRENPANPALCSLVAGTLHFLFLAAFAWMLVEGIHVYYMLVKIFESARNSLWKYYLIGYALPAVVVIASVSVSEGLGIHGYGTEKICWLDYEKGLIWSFAGPVLIVVLVNLLMFIKAITIAKRTMKKRSGSGQERARNTITIVKGSLSLLCLLGLTWLFGFTYFAHGAEWMAVIFALMNSLQGFFILLFQVILNDKARQEVRRHFKKNFGMAKALLTGKPYEFSATLSDTSHPYHQQNNPLRHLGISNSSFTLSSEARSLDVPAGIVASANNNNEEEEEEVASDKDGQSDEKISLELITEKRLINVPKDLKVTMKAIPEDDHLAHKRYPSVSPRLETTATPTPTAADSTSSSSSSPTYTKAVKSQPGPTILEVNISLPTSSSANPDGDDDRAEGNSTAHSHVDVSLEDAGSDSVERLERAESSGEAEEPHESGRGRQRRRRQAESEARRKERGDDEDDEKEVAEEKVGRAEHPARLQCRKDE